MLKLNTKFFFYQFVCVGGSANRLSKYAKLFSEESNLQISENLSKTDRKLYHDMNLCLLV